MRWPEASNLFGTIDSTSSTKTIASWFAAAGWQSRKTSWYDYEVECVFAQLVIEASQPILIHGTVAELDASARSIADILNDAGATFTLECYGLERQLLFTLSQDKGASPYLRYSVPPSTG